MILYGMGNHESRMLSDEGKHPDAVRRFRTLTEALDVRILDERAVTLRDGSGSVRVSGVTLPDEYYEKGRKKTPEVPLFSNGMISPGILNVAMVHSPLYMEEAVKEGADLVLSGHFHGGTIYLGKLGGLMTPQLGFFEKRVRGMFHYGTGAGIVSAGLGTHSIKLRLNNKPEIVCITLRKGS